MGRGCQNIPSPFCIMALLDFEKICAITGGVLGFIVALVCGLVGAVLVFVGIVSSDLQVVLSFGYYMGGFLYQNLPLWFVVLMGVLSENCSLRFLLVVAPSVSQVLHFWRFERNDYISSFLSNFYY